MIKLADYRTEDAFPSEMKTASRCAAAYAFDQEKKRILEAKKRVLIWASLENVPDDKLDVLAVENRVLFYNSGLDPSIKRQLIQNSIYWYIFQSTLPRGERQQFSPKSSLFSQQKLSKIFNLNNKLF